MIGVFEQPPIFRCIACGAGYLPESKQKKLCDACFASYERWTRRAARQAGSSNALNRWLARWLTLEAKRLEKFGVSGRCEAVTRGPNGYVSGFNSQCRGHATHIRDGRRVCGSHNLAARVVFAGTSPHDPYADWTRLMVRLSKADSKFADCVRAAASEPL